HQEKRQERRRGPRGIIRAAHFHPHTFADAAHIHPMRLGDQPRPCEQRDGEQPGAEDDAITPEERCGLAHGRTSIAVMNLRDEPGFVRITELHLVDGDRAFPRRSALGRFENESSAMSNRYRFVSPRDWIFDWLQRDSETVAEPGSALEAVDFYLKRN